jgi:hypothetical protein
VSVIPKNRTDKEGGSADYMAKNAIFAAENCRRSFPDNIDYHEYDERRNTPVVRRGYQAAIYYTGHLGKRMVC